MRLEVRTKLIMVGLVALTLPAAPGCGGRVPSRTVPVQPQRIASVTLASDEILEALVPHDRLVAVTRLADDPSISNVAGRFPPSIARVNGSNPEQIIALAPDLACVASYNSADFLELLSRSGLTIYREESVSTLDQIEASILRLGKRVGEEAKAQALAAEMRQRRKRLAVQLQGLDARHRPRVLFWDIGFTAGRGSTIDEIIESAGGTNVARELGLINSAEITPERVVESNPDIILLAKWKADEQASRIETHPILRQLPAVRSGRMIAIESRYLTTLSHHVVGGIEQLARALHPERFATSGDHRP